MRMAAMCTRGARSDSTAGWAVFVFDLTCLRNGKEQRLAKLGTDRLSLLLYWPVVLSVKGR
jgi:hypothetical protein